MAIVRHAEIEDLPEMLKIYNDVIATSTAVYSFEPVTLQNRRDWFDTRRSQNYPILVATDEAGIIGFSSFGEFRGTWPAYAYSVEHSVYVRADKRGLGLGNMLVQALFPIAREQRKHVMIGAIDAENSASLRFHERLGFNRAGCLSEVGFKFGRWLDLVFMEKFIDDKGATRPEMHV